MDRLANEHRAIYFLDMIALFRFTFKANRTHVTFGSEKVLLGS